MREYAFLNKGLEIAVRDERPAAAEVLDAVQDDTVDNDVDAAGPAEIHKSEAGGIEQTFRFDRGLVDFVEYLNKRKDLANPTVISFEAEQSAGTRAAPRTSASRSPCSGTSSFTESVHTFANTINTPEGGTHEEGFRSALTSLVNRWGEEWGLIKKPEDRVSGRRRT